MAANNRAMTDEVKAFIVQGLASFDTPTQVVDAVKAEFGLTITPQGAQAYDPTKYTGRKLAAKWRVMFDNARKAFVEDSSSIPIAHRSTRLRALQRMAAKAEGKGNFPLAAQLHKQAAEEMGNAYTNKRELSGPGGKDLPAAAPAVAIFALPDNGRDG